MKIIKAGNKEQVDKSVRFKCAKCGCIFEADKTEYKVGQQYNEMYYCCFCPCCRNSVYSDVNGR